MPQFIFIEAHYIIILCMENKLSLAGFVSIEIILIDAPVQCLHANSAGFKEIPPNYP